MALIYTVADGAIYKYSTGTWATNRQVTTATLVTAPATKANLYNMYVSGRGGTVVNIGRFFLEFDTSGISVAPSEAELKIYNSGTVGSMDWIALKGNQTTGGVVAGDFDEILNASTPLGNSDASGAGTLAGTSVVEYSSEITTWNNTSYNSIGLNPTALSDMASEDEFKIVIIGYDNDYLDIASVGINVGSGITTSDYVGVSRDPYIDYTAGVAVTDNATFFGTNF